MFVLNCNSCGSPLEFNVLTQKYTCSTCGNKDPSATRNERIKKWALERKKILEQKRQALNSLNVLNVVQRLNVLMIVIQ